MKHLFVLAMLMPLTVIGCGSSGGTAAQAKSADPAVITPAPVTSAPVAPVTGTDPILVVYSNSITKSVTTGGVTSSVTMNGSCAVYLGNTYCWDDGWHRANTSSAFAYWGLVLINGTITQGNEGIAGAGDATDALFNTPVKVTASFINLLPGNVIEPDGSEQTMVTLMFANGTPAQIHCTADAQSNLTCPTFTLVVQ